MSDWENRGLILVKTVATSFLEKMSNRRTRDGSSNRLMPTGNRTELTGWKDIRLTTLAEVVVVSRIIGKIVPMSQKPLSSSLAISSLSNHVIYLENLVDGTH